MSCHADSFPGTLATLSTETESGVPMTVKIVNCPTCSTPVEWTAHSRFRPFCSERCKMKDLGAWATEQYKVPQSAAEHDELTQPPQDRVF